MDQNTLLSWLAIIIAAASFLYLNFWPGKLKFFEPYQINFYKKEYFYIAFPVNMTNTGSVIHSVHMLVGIVKSLDNGEIINFAMCKDLSNSTPDEHDIAEKISSFSINKKTSLTKMISFESEKPVFLEGNYNFTLYVHKDGEKDLQSCDVSFDFEIDDEMKQGLIEGNYHELKRYSLLEERILSKKQKNIVAVRRLLSSTLIISPLIALFVSLIIESFGEIVIFPSFSMSELLFFITLFCFFTGILISPIISERKPKLIRRTYVKQEENDKNEQRKK